MGHPPRIPVWLRDEQPVVYFVTICVLPRKPVLANDAAFAALQHAIARLQKWSILAALIMPDHMHLLIAPLVRDEPLGNAVGALKRWIRQEIQAPWTWQPGSFDRLLRSDESAQEKWLYIRDNPVRAGLVTDAADWPYQIGLEL